MKPPSIICGLRYYPVFLLTTLLLGVGLSFAIEATLTRHWVNQSLVPRFHPVTLANDDWVEITAHGADRRVLVRHSNGSVTDAGQLQGLLRHFRDAPSNLVVAALWFAGLFLLASFWPRREIATPNLTNT